jgi:hypothetical protein
MAKPSTDPNRAPGRGPLSGPIPRLVLVAAVVLSFGGFLFLRSGPHEGLAAKGTDAVSPGPERPGATAHEVGIEFESPSHSPGLEAAGESEPADDIVAAELAFERARERHAAAVNQVARAQAAVDESERAVEDLERFIEDLRAQGEDPADHAEEGMERFRPAFDAYEKAAGQLERAEALEALALEERRSAEQRWEAARRSVRNEP